RPRHHAANPRRHPSQDARPSASRPQSRPPPAPRARSRHRANPANQEALAVEPRLAATARRLILAAVLVGLSATVARADDVDPEARRHLERGLALYAEGD